MKKHFSGELPPDPLEKALRIRDPERRCVALLKLLPSLTGARRAKAVRAALAAARAVTTAARRAALVLRVTRVAGGTPRGSSAGKKRAKKSGAKRAGAKKAGAKRTTKSGPKLKAKPRAVRRAGGGSGGSGSASVGSPRWRETPLRRERPRALPDLDKLPLREDLTFQRRIRTSPFGDRPAGTVGVMPRFDGMEGDVDSESDIDEAPDEPPARPTVSLGFAPEDHPASPISENKSLQAGTSYYFWVEIGARVPESLTAENEILPVEKLPANARLDVVLFGNKDGFLVADCSQSIEMSGRAQFRVAQPRRIAGVTVQLRQRRLFFPIETPWKAGRHRLRCCIYCRGLLVQSYDVEALVEERASVHTDSVQTSHLDYTISSTLSPDSLASPDQPEHRLSILFNDDGKGGHAFRFVGSDAQYCKSASFDVAEVQDLIDRARGALRSVSWGAAGAWQVGMAYRYETPATLMRLTPDLARLAIAGFRNYDAMIQRIDAGGRLVELMRRPGMIQLALKESARLVLPLSIIYDYRLDADGPLESYTLCETFVRNVASVEDTPCFRGDCPHRDVDDNRVICPSGFWGFRHEIGVPPSIGSDDDAPDELPSLVACSSLPTVVAAVSADPDMRERDAHLTILRSMFGALTVADTRAAVLEQLRTAHAHIVYFYCHGGIDEDRSPFLQVGTSPDRIGRSTLLSARVHWTEPRSLVFLNGCHTTDLEPERAIELVSGFVQTARSSGVIGTEITVFEPLAVAFAEAFMRRLVDGATVGNAVRSARLELLQDWNPLGLVYVPFAMATLRFGTPPST